MDHESMTHMKPPPRLRTFLGTRARACARGHRHCGCDMAEPPSAPKFSVRRFEVRHTPPPDVVQASGKPEPQVSHFAGPHRMRAPS